MPKLHLTIPRGLLYFIELHLYFTEDVRLDGTHKDHGAQFDLRFGGTS